jgi:hypothetical protein
VSISLDEAEKSSTTVRPGKALKAILPNQWSLTTLNISDLGS